MAERYENLEKALCKELEKLDKKYGGDVGEMSQTDIDTAHKVLSALAKKETYHAMKEAEEEDQRMRGEYSGNNNGYNTRVIRGRSYDDGMSFAPMRSPYTGRYVSREIGDRNYSGHYPMEYIDPYWDRRY